MPKSPKTDMQAATKLSRRALLKHSAVALGAGMAGTTAAQAKVVAGEDIFDYEITQTDAQWLEQLDEHDYALLRLGETEQPFTHPYWQLRDEGTFHCKGCDLLAYDSKRKHYPDKGWVFFTAGEPNAHMTSVDLRSQMMVSMVDETPTQNDISASFFMEVHCRRCGSHHGHIVSINSRPLHCINGGSLVFKPTTA